ncbi:MAG: CvpA family protein [Bacillales bacterium]|nr:CvpA family protein [Bacillales bacterium]
MNIIDYILGLDVTTIANTLNYFFLVIAAVAIIGFIIGLIKGFYRSSSALIATVIVFVILFLFNKVVANSLYNSDITYLNKYLSIDIPDGVTTLGELIKSYAKNYLENLGCTITDYNKMGDSIDTIAKCVINILSYFVLLLIGLPCVLIIDVLFYNLVFRFIISKENRKHHKKRLLGSVVGLVNSIVIFSLFISPFSALINSVTKAVTDENGDIVRKEIDDKYYNAIMNVLEGYNNSSVAKFFFTFSTKDGTSFDVKFMDSVTSGKLNNGEVIETFSEIGRVGGIAVEALSTGAIKATGEIDYALLLGSTFVSDLLVEVSSSTLLQTLLAMGVTVALNIDSFKSTIDLSSFDFFDVDWSNNISAINGVYQELTESGIITDIITNREDFQANFHFDDAKYAPRIKNALLKLDDIPLIQDIVPMVVVSYLKNIKNNNTSSKKSVLKENEESSISSILDSVDIPEVLLDVNTYDDFKWGEELFDLYTFVEGLSTQYSAYYNKNLVFSDFASLNSSTLLDVLFGKGVDFSSEEDIKFEDKYDNNPFFNGGTYNGKNIDGTYKLFGFEENNGLLDLQLVDLIFSTGLFNETIKKLDFDKLIGNTSDAYSFSDSVHNLIDNWGEDIWKDEIGAIIKVLLPCVDLLDLFSSEESEIGKPVFSISLENILSEKALRSLSYTTDLMGNSRIINEILPEYLEFIFEQNDQQILPDYNLSNMNFTYFPDEGDSLNVQIKNLTESILSCGDNLLPIIKQFASNEGNLLDVIVDDCALGEDSCFGKLLKIVYNNQIFNPKIKEDSIDKQSYFTKMMVSLLSETEDETNKTNIYNLTNHLISIKKETITSIDENPNWSWEKEIDGLVNFIGSLKATKDDKSDQVILNYATGKTDSSFDMTKEIFKCGDEIERIFASVEESKLLLETMPKVVNSLIGDSFNNSFGIDINFNNIESWEDEGVYFNKFLSNVNDVVNGESLDSIDWTKVDKDLLTEDQWTLNPTEDLNYDYYLINNSKLYKLLSSVYDTQCIGGKYEDNLRINGVFDSLIRKICIDTASNSLGINYDSCLEKELIDEDFEISSREIIYNDLTFVSWKGDLSKGYRGEIANITRLLNSANDISASTNIKDMTTLLDKVNDAYVFRTLLSVLIEDKIDTFATYDLTKKFVDKSDFTVLHKEDLSLTPYIIIDNVLNSKLTSKLTSREEEIANRKEEIDCITDVLDNIDEVTSALQGADIYESAKSILVNKELSHDENDKDVSTFSSLLTSMEKSKVFNHNLSEEELNAFEYVFSYIINETEVKDYFKYTEDSLFKDISKNHLWIKEDGSGELKNFNDSLYNLISNPLINILNNSSDYIKELNNLLEEKTPIQDLFLSMHQSIILDNSLAYVIDNKIIPEINKAINYENELVYVEGKVYEFLEVKLRNMDIASIKEKLSDYNPVDFNNEASFDNNDIMNSVWKNEGKQLEGFIKNACLLMGENSDFSSLDINSSDLVSKLDGIFDNMTASLGLNYLDEDYGFDKFTSSNEASIYHLLIKKIVKTTNEELVKIDIDTTSSNELNIKDHKKEGNNLLDIINKYKTSGLGDDFDAKNFGEEKLNNVEELLKSLYASDLYHYTKNSSRITEDSIVLDKKHYLSVFEQFIYIMISKMGIDNDLYNIDNINQSDCDNAKDVIFKRICAITENDNKQVNREYVWFNDDTHIGEIRKINDVILYNIDFTKNKEILTDDRFFKYDEINDTYQGFLVNINKSYLLHDVLANYIYRVNNEGFEYTVDENEKIWKVNDLVFIPESLTNKRMKIFDNDKALYDLSISFDQCVSFWNNDLRYLKEAFISLNSIMEKEGKIEEIITTDENSKLFEPLLSNLSHVSIYEDIIDQLLISILSDYAKVSYSIPLLGTYNLTLADFITNETVSSEAKDSLNNNETLINKYAKYLKLVSLYSGYGSNVDWLKEGKGLDLFVKSTKGTTYPTDQDYKLADHMNDNFHAYISSIMGG